VGYRSLPVIDRAIARHFYPHGGCADSQCASCAVCAINHVAVVDDPSGDGYDSGDMFYLGYRETEMETLRGMWSGLDNTGRIAFIITGGVVIVAGLYFGIDWSEIVR